MIFVRHKYCEFCESPQTPTHPWISFDWAVAQRRYLVWGQCFCPWRSLWDWVRATSAAVTDTGYLCPESPLPLPPPPAPLLLRDPIFIIYTQGFSGPIAGADLRYLALSPFFCDTHTHTYYTYTHSVYAHTHTLRYKERIILPGSSFSVSNLLSSSWLLWALSCELCYNEDIFEKKQTKTIKPHEVHWDSYFLIYMFYAPHQTKSLSWWN